KPKEQQFPKPSGVIGDILDAKEVPSDLLRDHPDLDQLTNQPVDPEGSTLLHLASLRGDLALLRLLLELGWDPSVKSKTGKVPYTLASYKEVRNEFRTFMGQFPSKYDYKTAQIPPPLSEEAEAEKAERKKALNKLKREKEKKKKAEVREKEVEAA